MEVKTDSTANITVEGKSLDDVDTFTYLGSGATTTGRTEENIKPRIGKARGAFVMLNKILKDRTISLNTKIRMFNCNVKSVLYYDCMTWKTTVSCIKNLQTFVKVCLRKFLRMPWVRNEVVWGRTGHIPVVYEVGRRHWSWIGPTLRRNNQNIVR